ncbi:MAG: 3-hydroxyisobutyrate dehydrogenase [Geminicoccaceae bacterium]|nr:3-hydroxyisobutyrate dehydrogenase [Geminicoccaceae bacterium]
MSAIGFIGLGNMGLPMARNLARAGHRLRAFDVVPASVEQAVAAGAIAATSSADASAGAEVVITMLPEGRHVREVYLGAAGVIAHAEPGALLIDCSTIDVETARAVNGAAGERGFEVLDAPVSGGVAGAEKATLTFMVGGSEAGVARARPVLAQIGKVVVHAGPSGNGQAAKICNNMMLGISMIGVCEAFVLAERLGLAADKLFEVSSQSSGQCWSLTNYCPVPGLVPSSPANRGYQPGFTAAMMAKDLRLAQAAAQAVDAPTPLGAEARQLYALFTNGGHGRLDFSAIIKMLAGSL